MNNKNLVILISGCPGVGKTTIIKEIVGTLQRNSLHIEGFYTEEIRSSSPSRERLGFDIVQLNNGKRDMLARCSDVNSVIKRPKVGKYTVFVDEFEMLALPIFNNKSNCLIIDEIGKMELLSQNFEKELRKIMPKLKSGGIKLIATIPDQKRRKSIKLIDELACLENSKIFEITKENRNHIYEEIEKFCLENIN